MDRWSFCHSVHRESDGTSERQRLEESIVDRKGARTRLSFQYPARPAHGSSPVRVLGNNTGGSHIYHE